MGALAGLRSRARQLKQEAVALYYACRDARTPWYARLLAAGVLAYALSPLDLIPDFIPVLGIVDDLILVPLGILLVAKLVPAEVMDDCRARARMTSARPTSRMGVAVVIATWLLIAFVIGFWLLQRVESASQPSFSP
jgi:uncharacterized membrane protein YkvA (DUF1232 family)